MTTDMFPLVDFFISTKWTALFLLLFIFSTLENILFNGTKTQTEVMLSTFMVMIFISVVWWILFIIWVLLCTLVD